MAIAQVDLVGDSRPVVTPQATQSMIEGIRGGFITANEIIERASERSKAKERAEIALANQATAEATQALDPALIEAKRSQQLLAGEQAQQTRDLLPMARRATEEKLNADIRSGQIARYGLKEKLEALNNVGFAPAPDPDKGITPEFALEVNKKFGTMLRWQKKKADGVFNSALFDAGELVVPSGETVRGPMDKVTGAPGDPKQISQWRKDAAMTLPEFLLAEPPGGVVAPVDIQPVTQTAAPIIQPVAQAPAPVIQPAGVPPGFIQVKPAPVTAESTAAVKRTDALQRELVQLQSVDASINQARQLAVPGIVGPGQIGVTRGMHQLLAALGSDAAAQTYTSQDQLNNVIADEIAEYVRDWKGAISDKELRFFQAARPRIDSTPERWTGYLNEWQTKNEKLKKIVAGELAPDEPAVWAANPKSSAISGSVSAATPAIPLPASPSATPIVSTIAQFNALPSGTVFREPDGTLRKKP